MTTVRNLSRAVTLMVQQQHAEAECWDELAAFHAPSECYPDAEKGLARGRRLLRRRIKSITGVPMRVLHREIRRRTSARWAYFHLGI